MRTSGINYPGSMSGQCVRGQIGGGISFQSHLKGVQLDFCLSLGGFYSVATWRDDLIQVPGFHRTRCFKMSNLFAVSTFCGFDPLSKPGFLLWGSRLVSPGSLITTSVSLESIAGFF